MAAVVVLMCSLALAACGGESATAPYSCVSGSGASDCANALQLPSASELFSFGFYSDVDIVPLACDTACRASSGNPMAPGYILNSISVVDASGTYFISIGYTTLNGRDVYFYDSNLPGQSYSLHVPLGETEIGPGYSDTYTSTGMRIEFDPVARSGTTFLGTWSVQFHLRHAAQLGAVGDHTYTVAMSSPYFGFGTSDGNVVLGQRLYGHSGATAIAAIFANNQIGEIDEVFGCRQVVFCPVTYAALDQDGTVVTRPHPGAPPPYAGWLITATRDGGRGGLFYTECCRPVHILLGP